MTFLGTQGSVHQTTLQYIFSGFGSEVLHFQNDQLCSYAQSFHTLPEYTTQGWDRSLQSSARLPGTGIPKAYGAHTSSIGERFQARRGLTCKPHLQTPMCWTTCADGQMAVGQTSQLCNCAHVPFKQLCKCFIQMMHFRNCANALTQLF